MKVLENNINHGKSLEFKNKIELKILLKTFIIVVIFDEKNNI